MFNLLSIRALALATRKDIPLRTVCAVSFAVSIHVLYRADTAEILLYSLYQLLYRCPHMESGLVYRDTADTADTALIQR